MLKNTPRFEAKNSSNVLGEQLSVLLLQRTTCLHPLSWSLPTSTLHYANVICYQNATKLFSQT